MTKNYTVFSTQCYGYLNKSLCKLPGFSQGTMTFETFSDGEHYIRIDQDLTNLDVVVIGSTIPGNHFLEFYDLASGVVSMGARSLTMVVPYYAYSTMERAVKSGEVVTAKTRARLMSSLPAASWGNRIIFIDLHSEGITHYLEGHIRPTHLYSTKLITEAALSLGGQDFILASTDAGRAKWVEALANQMGVSCAFLMKKRHGDARTSVVAPAKPVDHKTVIIYDDMIRSGGSLIGAAKAYKDAGASKIFALTTHGIFSGNGLEKLKGCGYIEKIICTDTVPGVTEKSDDFLQVSPISGMLAESLKNA